ncbi:histidine kinase [Oribacterium sp. C9]|uniref:HD domain-containing phosphohydrolase n=1 Tax=Oribacterium sp. C9 TaxID=1943579 RepID=UPI00098FF55A|nr:HD domain-containing phosphohydrolase [Oribacterium sp. C9]OON87641.1 histidine kinase [Oribacterium sp. C9]
MLKPFVKNRKLILFYLVLTMCITATFSALGNTDTSFSESGTVNLHLSVDPAGINQEFSAVLYNNTNGLPTSEANTIAETSEGFIWIGSYSGLIRYDGNTFVRFDSTTGISSVISLFVDSKERLWAGTNDAGLAMLDHDEIHKWGEKEGLKYLRIMSISEDAQGNVYASTDSGIAMVGEDLTLHYVDDKRIADSSVEKIRQGSDGTVYGATSTSDIFTLKNGQITNFIDHETSGFEGITYVLPDEANPGYVYLGTEGSIVYYGELNSIAKKRSVYDISPLSGTASMEHIQGQLWLCTENGIGVIDHGRFTQIKNLPLSNSVENMITDYSGNLWFTSSRQGVMKIVPNQFTDLFEPYDLPHAVVNTTCFYGDQLFVGSDTGLIVMDNNGPISSLPLKKAVTASGNVFQATDLIEYLNGIRIRSIIRDSKGRLWISTWCSDGLLRYDAGELMAFTEKDGLMSGRIRTACETKDGSILVVNTGGISVIRDDRVTETYDKSSGISISENLSVVQGFNDEILLGSNGAGIFVLNNGKTKHITTQDGLSSGIVMRIKRDDKRKLYWMVTSNSIEYMTEDYEVHTIKNFPYSNNYDLYENKNGDMWILSSNGIYVVPVDELVKNESINPVYYGLDSGLPSITTANSYSELTEKGELYIASSECVVKVNIDTPFENVSELKAAVPFIDADGVRLYPEKNGSFILPADTHKITVNSFVYNYSLINPQVTYQLDGFDIVGKTVERSNLVPVDYTNLRGGTYNFIMHIKDSMGRGDKEVSISITKKKAYYEEPWFYILFAVVVFTLLALMVRLYIRSKMRALEKKNQETMTLVEEITEAFAKVIDMKDRYTNGHSSRVAHYTSMLAKELGYDDETVKKYYRIALLHDIGKIGVPSTVLNKSGKLTDEEFEIIQSHTTKGYEALKDISIMPELSIGAQAHHERPDGKGYPNHLKGTEIPRVAQIIAVADCFDAMYSNRPYRNRMNFEKVVSIIKDVSGTQLTSDVVDAFLRLVEKGEFKDPEDDGGGSTEDIVNIKK